MQVTDTKQLIGVRSDVLRLMQANRGVNYRCDNLAEQFGTGVAAMRNTLLLLLGEGRIRQSTGTRRTSYFVSTDAMMQDQANEITVARPFRPLKRGIGMVENINRAKEAREQYKSIG